MISREQALTARKFHYGECKCTTGPRGGKTVKVETWRRNGATKTWKTRPEDFVVPIKYGLKSCSLLTHRDAEEFHTAEDCPLNKEE